MECLAEDLPPVRIAGFDMVLRSARHFAESSAGLENPFVGYRSDGEQNTTKNCALARERAS